MDLNLNSLVETYGLWTALLAVAAFGLYKLFERVFPGALERWQDTQVDRIEHRQAMAERIYDLRSQLETIDAGRKAAADTQAFEIIDKLLNEKQHQIAEIREALLKLTVIIADVQQETHTHNRRTEERLKNINQNLSQVWGLMAELRDGLKDDKE